MGYSPRGHKESDTTERLHFHFPLLILENNISYSVNMKYLLPHFECKSNKKKSKYNNAIKNTHFLLNENLTAVNTCHIYF